MGAGRVNATARRAPRRCTTPKPKRRRPNEILMHGWDIAHVVETAVVDDEAALPVLAVLTPLTAAFIDPEALKTRGCIALCP